MKERCCDMQITTHMDKQKRERVILRLKRVRGQVEGIMRMLEKDRKCVEILNQILSIMQAIRGIRKEILKNYLQTCVKSAILSGKKDIYDEVVNVFEKYDI